MASAVPLDRPGRIDRYLVIEGLPALLSAGSVVVAPDYPGLGVTGPSSYLIGTSEARSLLDAVRVARQLPTDASTETLLWGHSQGGHACSSPLRKRARMRRSSPSARPRWPPQRGGRMTFRLYPKDTHGTIATAAMPDVLAFLSGGLASAPPASTC